MPDLADLAEQQYGLIALPGYRCDPDAPAPLSDAKEFFIRVKHPLSKQRSERYQPGRLVIRLRLGEGRSLVNQQGTAYAREVGKLRKTIYAAVRFHDVGHYPLNLPPPTVARPTQIAHREAFVSGVQRLARLGNTASALDLLYDSVDRLMQKGEFQRLDSVLSGLVVSELSLDLMLGFLTATLPARKRLASRMALYQKIEQELKQRGEYEEGLLTGLE
jgi:hypothetical protein